MGKTIIYSITLTSLLLASPAFADSNPVNKSHTLIASLSDDRRNVVLAKLLRDNGQNCDAATQTFFQGFGENGTAYWNVGCHNKNTFALVIANDEGGSTKILSCDSFKTLKVGECFKKF